MTDGQLLEQFVRQQEPAAFETLVRRHGPMVMRVCQRLLRHGPDADDAFQATFIVLVRKAHSIIKLESVASWLYGVAYRIALRAKSRANRRQNRERPMDEGALPGETSAANDGATADLRPVLDEELNRLPEKYRAPVVLCYLEGKTNEEAARQLQCPTGTVKIRLSRARDLLRDRLARRGVGITAGAIALALTQEIANAAIPAALTATTAQAAALAATGKAGAAVSGASSLADATLKAMTVVKIKIAAAVVATASIVAAGAFVAANRGPNEPMQLHATLQHPDGVFTAAFTPDGQTVVTGGGDRIIRVWDISTGQEIASLGGHRLPILSLAVSPDGTLLASGDGDINGAAGVVKLWDLKQRRELATLPAHEQGAPSLAFAPNGRVLASASWSGIIRLWDVASRERLAVMNSHTSGVGRISFSPRGDLLASASNDRTVKLWDATSGKERGTLRGHTDVVQAMDFAPDGSTIASGSRDQTVRLWDVNTPTARLVIPAGSPVHFVSFAPRGKVVLSGHTETQDGRSHGVLKLWNTATGELIDTIPVHSLQVGNALFSPDGKRLLTTSWDRTAKLWDVNTGSKIWAGNR